MESKKKKKFSFSVLQKFSFLNGKFGWVGANDGMTNGQKNYKKSTWLWSKMFDHLSHKVTNDQNLPGGAFCCNWSKCLKRYLLMFVMIKWFCWY